MGIFAKMFGGQPEYPELGTDTAAAERLNAIRDHLEKLAREVSDPLEVVPGENGGYVFIGKPPKRFGIAWIEGDEVKSFKSLMAEYNLSAQNINRVSDELREAYQRHQETPRYRATIAERDVVITPSEPLAMEVGEILSRLN